MSRRIAVNHNVCDGDGAHPVDSLKFVNYTIIENVRKKIFVFYVAVICTTAGVTEQIRTCVCRYAQSV